MSQNFFASRRQTFPLPREQFWSRDYFPLFQTFAEKLALWIKKYILRKKKNFHIIQKKEKHEKIPQSILNTYWKVKKLFGIGKNDFSSRQNMMSRRCCPPLSKINFKLSANFWISFWHNGSLSNAKSEPVHWDTS